MHSVMLLIVSFGALAGLYVLLDAPFTAVTQIIIYAGAIMVLFLFVVMLLNVPREEPRRRCRGPAGAVGRASRRAPVGCCWRSSRLGAVGLGGVLPARTRPASVSSVTNIGPALFTTYSFAFEVTSILILVSMVGAVVIARKEHHCMVPLNHYLILSAILFSIGTAGVFLRRNLITVLLSIEIMLNAVNLTFVAVGPVPGTRRPDHHVLRHDGRGRRGGGGSGARHRALPPPRDAQPGRVHVPQVVTCCC